MKLRLPLCLDISVQALIGGCKSVKTNLTGPSFEETAREEREVRPLELETSVNGEAGGEES